MSEKYGIEQDPYCYPDTHTLINLLDIRDNDALERVERKLTELAIEKISFSEPPYNFVYFTDLHRILFSDIYEWAGKIRNVDISLGDTH
jgi:cell filamentation protein